MATLPAIQKDKGTDSPAANHYAIVFDTAFTRDTWRSREISSQMNDAHLIPDMRHKKQLTWNVDESDQKLKEKSAQQAKRYSRPSKQRGGIRGKNVNNEVEKEVKAAVKRTVAHPHSNSPI
jgi:hypothetical protein